jgi:hypothetical protein
LVQYVETVLPVTQVDEWQGADWSGAPATIRLFRVNPSSAPTTLARLTLADSTANLYLGAGWSPVADANGWRLAERAAPLLLLDLPVSGATVRLTADPAPVAATVNGAPVALRQEGSATRLDVPARLAGEPVDAVQLHFAGEGAAVAELGQDAPIGATGLTLPAGGLLVRSAGEEVGDFAHIYVNGRDVGANARGYNLVALSPAGGVLGNAVFDTMVEGAADSMAAWLTGWPAGTIIAGAVADEASTQLNQAAVDALRSVGVATDLRGRFRWSHAFVGAAGAAPGSALERAGLLAPATVYVGAPASGARIFGRLQAIEIVPTQGE